MYIYYFCQSVQLPDGFQASVTHIDTVHCSSSLALTNIFHISSVKFNLLSISQLTKSTNYDVTFSFLNVYSRIRQQRRRLVGVVLEMVFLDADLYFNLSCLGHPSRSRFEFIVENSPIIVANKDFISDICPCAKQQSLSFFLKVHLILLINLN